MSKGLIRSLSRAPEILQKVVKRSIPISASVDITGVADTVDAATVVVAGLPEGNILLLGAVASVGLDATGDTHVIDNFGGDYGIGTAPNADVDLGDAEDVNIIASTALTAGAADKIAPLTRASNATTAMIDNTAGAMEINLNILIDDNVITDTEDGTFVVSGILDIVYVVLGDD